MKKSQLCALMVASALMSLTGLTACSSSQDVDELDNPNVEYDNQGNAGVRPEFVISLPRSVVSSKTRMSDAETQSSGSVDDFRGMDHIRLIAFGGTPTGSSAKLGSIMSLTSIAGNALKKPGSLNYKVYSNQFVPVTTKHFLFYGKAIDNAVDQDITTMADKFKYGVIKATGLTESEFTNPGSISFGLEQINASTEQQQSNAVGRSIVTFMTNLANITSSGDTENAWSTSTNVTLQRLYANFIRTTVSSSANFAAILGMIYDGVERVIAANDASKTLAQTIKTQIVNVSKTTPVVGSPISLKDDYAGYPANVGLPDGAARVSWNSTSKKFVDMSADYGGGLKVGITDYVYPAALWYYVSTPLKASNVVKSGDYDAQTSWANVINNVYSGAEETVGGSTLSVALVNPVQYAVGRIETKLEMGTGTFFDGAGEEVVTGSGYTLKGLLLGGQNNVKYDFTTSGTQNWTIYDREVPAGITVTPGNTTSKANQTLALETKKDEKVYAAVELVNGGDAFMGSDGIIPAGGTFYLTVTLDPKAASTTGYSETVNKIVMQDYVTKITVKIKNGKQTVDRDNDGNPDIYVFDGSGNPIGVNTGDGTTKTTYDINGDGTPDTFISVADGGPGWDTDGDGIVDIPVMRDPSTGQYPTNVLVPEGLGNATNGIPNLTSPGVELGTSVDLEWKPGLTLAPSI